MVKRGVGWVKVRMSQLKKGDRFRMTGDKLCPEGDCIAYCDAFRNGSVSEPGPWTIDADTNLGDC